MKKLNGKRWVRLTLTIVAGVPACLICLIAEFIKTGLAIPFWIINSIERGIGQYKKVNDNGAKIYSYTEKTWQKMNQASLTAEAISLNSIKVLNGDSYRRFTHLFSRSMKDETNNPTGAVNPSPPQTAVNPSPTPTTDALNPSEMAGILAENTISRGSFDSDSSSGSGYGSQGIIGSSEKSSDSFQFTSYKLNQNNTAS